MKWEEVILDAAETDTGVRRANNQDSFAVVRATNPEAWRKHGHVFLVADGMGAHAVGELASKMACDHIPHTYKRLAKDSPEEALIRAYRDVAQQIHTKSKANRDFEGMGTTCSALVLGPEGALIAHVGDSRIYRTRSDVIDQLTFDHSLVWELRRKSGLPLDDDANDVNARKNVITRSLGPDPEVTVDIEGPLAVKTGDVFLLCTDGLSGQVRDPELGLFCGHLPPEEATRALLQLANLRGGPDNITVIVVRVGPWVDPDASHDNQPVAAAPAAGRKFSLGGLLGSLRKPAEPPVEEEEPYRSFECPLTAEAVEKYAEFVARVEQLAHEHTWPADFTQLDKLRARWLDALSHQRLHTALRAIGEAIVLLGLAKRVFFKNRAAAASSG